MSPEIRVLFDALPYYLQEQALGVLPLRAFNSPSGSATDQAARALFESEVRRLYTGYVAERTAQEAPAPTSRVTARSASPSSPWFPSTAPRSAAPPAAAPRAAAPGLPADIDEALDVALDHVRLAERIGAPPATCAAILNGYLRDLWRRPSVRERFDRFEVLESWVGFLRKRGKH